MQLNSVIISLLASFFRVKLVLQVFQALKVKMANLVHLENLVQMDFQELQEKGYVFHRHLKGNVTVTLIELHIQGEANSLPSPKYCFKVFYNMRISLLPFKNYEKFKFFGLKYLLVTIPRVHLDSEDLLELTAFQEKRYKILVPIF